MKAVRDQPSPRHIDKLRVEHQAQAKLAAESGRVPKAFHGDPTFVELVSVKKTSDIAMVFGMPTSEIGSDLLAKESDEPANSSG